MLSLRNTTVVAVMTATVLSASLAMPAHAGQTRNAPALSRLDTMPAEYTQYRRGWYGYRHGGWRGPSTGAVVAGAVGLGILGAAAAAAASRPVYAEPYDYGYAAPVYEPYPPVYAPPVYRRYYAPGYDFRYDR